MNFPGRFLSVFKIFSARCRFDLYQVHETYFSTILWLFANEGEVIK